MPNNNVAGLLSSVQEISKEAYKNRTVTRSRAVPAIRLLEKALADALAGEPLRGLKELGTHGSPFRGARVRALVDARIGVAWDPGGHDPGVLCLDSHGKLVMVSISEAPEKASEIRILRAHNEDFFAEDLRSLVETLLEVLPRHIVASQTAAKKYEQVSELAEKIRLAIKG